MGLISAVSGNLVSFQADAIATLVNAGGMWVGRVDMAIYDVAGEIYHDQLDAVRMAQGLVDQQVVVVEGDRSAHRGGFNHIVFVVDQRIVPLRNLVEKAIEASIRAGHKSIALPLMRTGVMLGKVEKTMDQVIVEMTTAIKRFRQSPIDITIVVYNDPETARQINAMLSE